MTNENAVKKDRSDSLCKIRYASDETGWAYDLGDGTFEVANVPLADGINFGDIVTIDENRAIKEVIKSKYWGKVAVQWADLEKIQAFTEEAESEEWGLTVEPGFPPSQDACCNTQPGVCLVSIQEDTNIEKLCEKYDLKVMLPDAEAED